MKRFLMLLVLAILLTGTASAQETVRLKFRWTQPDSTMSGLAMQDGWMQKYNIFLAADGDTNFVGSAPAPFAIADSAWAFVNVPVGVPTAIQVEGVDKWDQVGPIRSEWSELYIAIPEPPRQPGKPEAVDD
jgi:opacity protein-like surface antigen